MKVKPIIKKVLRNIFLLITAFTGVVLLSSCATQTISSLEPTIGSFIIPVITLSEPVEVQNEYNIYKVPLTSLTHAKRNEIGTIVKTENVNGFETFDAIGIIVIKVKKDYALIRLDDKEPKHILNAGDQIVDHIPESLQKLNKMDHDWLLESFQKSNYVKE
jgi:hypothetical protein